MKTRRSAKKSLKDRYGDLCPPGWIVGAVTGARK